MRLSIREGWFEPHIEPGVFAALLRDNIKRVAISGMRLPQGCVSQKYPALLDKPKTHTAFPLYIRERMIGFNHIEVCEVVTYFAGKSWIGSYVQPS